MTDQLPDNATLKVPAAVLMVSVATLLPVDVGLNRTVTVQVAPAPTELPQDPEPVVMLN